MTDTHRYQVFRALNSLLTYLLTNLRDLSAKITQMLYPSCKAPVVGRDPATLVRISYRNYTELEVCKGKNTTVDGAIDRSVKKLRQNV